MHIPPVVVGDLGELPCTFAFEAMSATTASTAIPARTASVLLEDLRHGRTFRPDRIIQEDFGFFLPRALARLAIDSHTDGEQRIQLINATTLVSLGYYAGCLTGAHCDQLQGLLAASGLANKNLPLSRHDSITDQATQPEHSQASAQRMLAKFASNESLLVVPLLEGGYTAGLETVLYYQRQRPNANTVIYPGHYSRLKAKHTAPNFTESEIEYLRALAADRTVVLFDEDASSIPDGTMARAVAFFSRELNHPNVYGIVNLDNRDSNVREVTGEWWGNCNQVAA